MMSSHPSRNQKKFGTFKEEELSIFRYKANQDYIKSCRKCSRKEPTKCFLTSEEEHCIVRHCEKTLRNFFQSFMPRNEPLPREVKGTSFHYYKRFYLFSSVMEFHPADVMLACVFLACKACDYPVSIERFAKCSKTEVNPVFMTHFLLDLESELLTRMNFRIQIYTPYKAIEDRISDLKSQRELRAPQLFHQHIQRFLGSMWYTDVCLLYSPPLIAIAAITHALSRCKESLDYTALSRLLCNPPTRVLDGIISTSRKIRFIVFSMKEPPTYEQISVIERKLATCRNPLSDPSSEAFQRRMLELKVGED